MVGKFSLQIGAFVRKTKATADIVVRRLSLELFRMVVLKTPVDTGRARANWQLAIGTMPEGVLELDDRSGTATISAGAAAAAGVKAGDVIYLANSLPYIRRLEYGWSQQAPNGMVRQSIAEIQDWLARIVGEAKQEAS